MVNLEWIQKGLEAKQIKQWEVSVVTGIEKGNLSAWISGAKPMSRPVRLMFYYLITNFSKSDRMYANKRKKYLKAINDENTSTGHSY